MSNCGRRKFKIDKRSDPCRTVPLGSEVKFISGGTPRKSEPKYWGGTIPWVSSAEMTQGRIENTERRVTEEGAKNGTKRVSPKTVLIVVRGMSLAKEFRVAITSRDVTFNQDLKALIPSKNVLPEFLYYYLLSQNGPIKDSASEAAHGTKKLEMRVLEQWPLPLLPLLQQQKIAAILSAYDDLIENNKRRIALIEKMAEEIYREWFVRMRFPGYERVKLVKNIPMNWNYEKLGNLCSIIKRGISPSYDDNSEMLVINQRCIRNGNIDLSVARGHRTRVPVEKFVEYGDALINSTGVGTLGRISIVEYEPKKLTVDSHVTICRTNKAKINSHYLSHSIKRLQGYFEYIATGATGQVELNRKLISDTKIVVPDEKSQELFSDIISSIWKKRSALTLAVNILSSCEKLLLGRLISGKLPVESLNIQFPPSIQTEQDAAHA